MVGRARSRIGRTARGPTPTSIPKRTWLPQSTGPTRLARATWTGFAPASRMPPRPLAHLLRNRPYGMSCGAPASSGLRNGASCPSTSGAAPGGDASAVTAACARRWGRASFSLRHRISTDVVSGGGRGARTAGGPGGADARVRLQSAIARVRSSRRSRVDATMSSRRVSSSIQSGVILRGLIDSDTENDRPCRPERRRHLESARSRSGRTLRDVDLERSDSPKSAKIVCASIRERARGMSCGPSRFSLPASSGLRNGARNSSPEGRAQRVHGFDSRAPRAS
jgi:hypothetical protein